MWTYTAYILNKFGEKDYSELAFKELSEFVFGELWKKGHLVFHDGDEDLLGDLRYLDKVKAISLREGDKTSMTLNRGCLGHMSKVVEDSALLTGVKLFDEYRKRIDRSFDSYMSQNEQRQNVACQGARAHKR
jgi:hypothetical protein